MLDQQINEQLGLLQKELLRLKTVTDYINGAKENSISIIAELEKVQQNYTVYTDKIFNLYNEYVEEIKTNTEIHVNELILNFETTGKKIYLTNKKKLVETRRLLEQYKNIVEATNSLVRSLEAVDFHTRLSSVDESIQAVNSALNEMQKTIESKQDENHAQLLKRINQQDNDVKLMKTILFILCGLVTIEIITTIIK